MKTTALAVTIVFTCGAATTALALDFNPLSLLKGAVKAVVEDRSTADIAKGA